MGEGFAAIGQLLFAGLAIGGVYSMVALGIVLIYRATNVVNFAQGEISMLGAYFLVTLWQGAQLDYLTAFVLALTALRADRLLSVAEPLFPSRHYRDHRRQHHDAERRLGPLRPKPAEGAPHHRD
jgi:branched-subunit amino acid ABC-type transport system permease component